MIINIFTYEDIKSDRQLYFDLGISFFKKNNPEKSIDYLYAAISEQNVLAGPSDTEINIALGNSLFQKGNYAESIKKFLNTSLQTPEYFSSILKGVSDHLNDQIFNSLTDWIDKEWKPEAEKIPLTGMMSDGLQHFWAVYDFFKGNYEKSETLFTSLLNKNAEDYRALKGLGSIYLKQGIFSKAERYFTIAKSFSTSNSIFHNSLSTDLIHLFLQSRKYQEAYEEIKNNFKSTEDVDQLKYLEVKALYGLKKYNEANDLVNQLMLKESLATNIEYHIIRVKICLANHEYQKALSLIELAYQADAINKDLLFLKVQTLIEGQINVEEGKMLFTEDKYGYLKQDEKGRERAIEKINEIISERSNDGNAFFFCAFIGNLINHDITILKAWIKEANTLGLKNDTSYPSTALYILKAEIAEKENDKQKTGQNYLEAAKNYYYQSNYNEALNFFNKAIQYTPEISEACVYCADLLFIKSYHPEPPYIDEKRLEEAYVIWHKQTDEIPKSQYDAWHYIVIARIHESYYKLREQISFFDYWQSVLYTERAIVHAKEDYSLFTYLGRFYRNLLLEINSLTAFEIAESLKKGDDILAEEKAILQLNTGNFEESLKYLDNLKQNNKYQPFHKSWEGFIAYHNCDYRLASNILEEYINQNKSDVFAYDINVHTYWQAKEFDKAKLWANEIILLQEKYAYPKEEYTFSWAYFIAGNTEKAIEILKESKGKGYISNGNPFSLSQFYLYTGKHDKANGCFENLIKCVFNERVLNEFFLDLTSLYAFAKAEKQSSQLLDQIKITVESWQAKVTEQLEYIKTTSITPEMELQYKLEELNVSEDSIPFITLQSGLARLHRRSNNFSQAYAIYNKLLKQENLFPEVRKAIDQIKTEMFTPVKSDINNGEYNKAIKTLRSFDLPDSGELYQKNLSLAFAYYGLNEKETSIDYLGVLFSTINSNEELQKSVWEDISVAFYNSKLTLGFVQFIYQNREAIQISNDGFLEMLIKNALEPLINKYTLMSPVVTPIAVEISGNLAEGADWRDSNLIKDLVPQMRDTILKDYGVNTRGIRFRGNEGDLPPDTFIIMLDEIPLVMSTVRSDKLFVHAGKETLNTFDIEGEETTHPASGEKALWIDKNFRKILVEKNIPFWDQPFQYIITFIHVFLSNNLDVFIDGQFCDDYLPNISLNKDTEGNNGLFEIAKTVRENPSLKILFSQTLKELVKEQVSIANKNRIIEQFLKAKDVCADVNDIVQGIRLNLKNELPVNKFELTHIELPAETETQIRNELATADNKTFLAMLPENCQKVLSAIRNETGGNPKPETTALLINDSKIRIHVRKLAEWEFPNLIIASREELTENQ